MKPLDEESSDEEGAPDDAASKEDQRAMDETASEEDEPALDEVDAQDAAGKKAQYESIMDYFTTNWFTHEWIRRWPKILPLNSY